MAKNLAKKTKSILLGKHTAYLITLSGGEKASEGSGTFYDGVLRVYLRDERKSVFGHLQPTKAERAAIDEWMNYAGLGDVLVARDRRWSITLISTEPEAIQTLQAAEQEPVYSTVSLRGKKRKKGKL